MRFVLYFVVRFRRSQSFVFFLAPAAATAVVAAGMQSVIVGMDRGVEGMRVGGSREIAIPAALG